MKRAYEAKKILEKKIKEYVKRNGLKVIMLRFRAPVTTCFDVGNPILIAHIYTRENCCIEATMEYGVRVKRHTVKFSK